MKYFVLLFVTLLISFSCFAQSRSKPVPRKVEPQTQEARLKEQPTAVIEVMEVIDAEDQTPSNSNLRSLANEIYLVKRNSAEGFSERKEKLYDLRKRYCIAAGEKGYSQLSEEEREVYLESLKFVDPEKLEDTLKNNKQQE